MSFSTPPNTPPRAPSAAAARIPVAAGPSTPQHNVPATPLAHAAHSLGRQFTENSGAPVAHTKAPITAGTPGKVSTVQDPSNRQTNDIHIFPKGLTTYRGDNSYQPNQTTPYCAQFFTFEKQIAKSQYGHLVLKFKLEQDIRLLRLDKNAEGFHHWLKNHPRFSEEGKKILYKNFGYPEDGLEHAEAGDQPRARISKGEQDRKMLQMIHSYAQETGQQIDGYYNGIMANGALGNLKTENGKIAAFHAELAVFDGSVFSQPVMENNLDKEEIDLLNQDAKRIRLEAEDREARRKSKKPRLNEEEEKVTPSKTSPAWGTVDKT